MGLKWSLKGTQGEASVSKPVREGCVQASENEVGSERREGLPKARWNQSLLGTLCPAELPESSSARLQLGTGVTFQFHLK